MIILKIGGSLYSSRLLKQWLEVLPELRGKALVIVPGGGPFADRVRRAERDHTLSQQACHEMAVLAMQQYGVLLADQHECFETAADLSAFHSLISQQKIPVWAPYDHVMNDCELSKDWQTTSDSLALWLAIRVQAQALYLLKSTHVAVATREGVPAWSARNVVDATFESLAQEYQGDIQIVHASQSDDFIRGQSS